MKGRWLSRREHVDDGSLSTMPGLTEPTITGEFALRVREDPYHPAIVGVPKPLTYGELAWLAEGYRAVVAGRGGSPLDRVALLLPHDASVVAAALGALSNRMSVIVLNPSDPPSRLAQICADVEPILLLAGEAYAEQAAAVAPPCSEVVVPDQSGFTTAVAVLPPLLGGDADPGDVAFLISTSGSTGRPKLVTQSHRNMVHNALRYSKGLGIRAEDRMAWSVSMSGGQGLATAWTALLTGAALCPYSLMERGIVGLASWIQTAGVTVLDTLPTVFRNFVRTLDDGQILAPRLVRLASEAAFQADFEMFRQHFASTATLATVWGSSEAGITAQGLFTTADAPPPGRLSVGHEAEGIEIVLVDDAGDEVPDGAEGRVVVRSRYLSPGYWGDDGVPEARLTDGPYGPQLLTGDLARRAADGSLFVTGRSDSQVKVRGHRLHLEEVEAAIVRHPEVKDARVVPRTHSNGDVTLSAFVVGRPDAALDGPAVQRSLREVLPGYSVPTTFMVLDSLPLTAHGKVDRDALLRLVPAPAIPGSRDSEIEEVLADLWREAFDRDDVDVEQAFLVAGGDSLAATVIAAGIHEIFGVELGLGIFAADPTISELATLINDQWATGVVTGLHEIERAPRRGSHPLSCAQIGFWTRGAEDPIRPLIAWPFDIRGDLDVTAFNESIVDITRRHEIFRTAYVEAEGVPVARIRDEPVTEFAFRDLRGLDDPHAAAADALLAEATRPFDLGKGPLFRSELLQLGDRHYRWIRSNHHIISDPTSWFIFLDELRGFYESRMAGHAPPKDKPPRLQFIDYVEWEREWPTREPMRFDAAVDHWRELFRAPPPHRQLPLGLPSKLDGNPAGLLHWGLPRPVSEQLDGVARAAKATYFMSRLAPYAALLAIESTSDDAFVGMSVSMRGRSELRGMIGPITNYGVVRCRDATDRTFNEWLREIRRLVIDLSAHRHVPFRLIGPELGRSGVPVPGVRALFATSQRRPIMPFGGLEIQQLPRPCPDLQLFRVGVNQGFEEDGCWVEFDLREHNEAAVRRYIHRLEAFIAAAASQPDIPLGHLVERLPA